ncbi:uncharacterized protein BDV17DRAFT_295696 [Aspergillus undulatus]|uniref:uncharacterized protein n=1 Tax=Aspergillus undulatus TaxID=1810928 RepID=UPI003CCD15F4
MSLLSIMYASWKAFLGQIVPIVMPTVYTLDRILESKNMMSAQAYVPTDSFAHSIHSGRVVPGLSETWEHTSTTNTTPHKASTLHGSTASSDLARSFQLPTSNCLFLSDINDTNHESLLDWIRSERMHKLPPEGSGYGKALVRARLFVERLHSFEMTVTHLAGDSQMNTPTQLAYAYCATLLGLGQENSDALLELFGFFYRCSTELDHLLSRTELNPVVEFAAHFQKSLGNVTTGSVAIDIQNTFSALIDSFHSRCEDAAELMWTHQLAQEGSSDTKGAGIRALREWLEPEDPVLEHVVKYTSQFAQEREESTCLWIAPHLTRFLKGNQRVLAVTGSPGSGKSILATVINDHLQHPIGGVAHQPIFVPTNSRIPALATPLAVAKCILSQLFASRIGNASLYKTLTQTYEQCIKTVDEETYVDLLWAALRDSLPATIKGARQSVLIIDGVDESSCGQDALMLRLNDATASISNLKLVVLGSEKHETFSKQTNVRVTSDLIFDDIAAVVRRVFHHSPTFSGLGADDQEVCVHSIVKASQESFLWAKLASKRIRDENPSSAQALTKDVHSFVKMNHTIDDLVKDRLQSKSAPQDGVKIMAWLATAARPLSITEIAALLSVQPEKGSIAEQNDVSPLSLLKPFASLVFFQTNMVYLRHGEIRSAINRILNSDKSITPIKEPQLDFIQRLLIYIKHKATGRDEPSLDLLESKHATNMLDFALRYWLGHTRKAFGCTSDQEVATAGKTLRQSLPVSPLAILLGMTIWKRKPTPALALLHDTQSLLYQHGFSTREPVTLQAVLCQTLFYRTVEDSQPTEASRVFYDTSRLCQAVLTVQHVITMHVIKHFLDFTESRTSSSKTEIMSWRTEMLQVLVECYKIHYGSTSEVVVSTLSQLAEHYQVIGEVQKAQQITNSLNGASNELAEEGSASRRPSEQSLVVQLHGCRDSVEHDTILTLDETFKDDQITGSSWSLDTRLARAERQTHEGNSAAAERTYVDIWQQASKEHRLRKSLESELRNTKALTAYSHFLKSQKRDAEVASVLSSFWDDREETLQSSSHDAVAQGAEAVLSEDEQQRLAVSGDPKTHTHSTYEEVINTVTSGTASVGSEAVLREMAASSSDLSTAGLVMLAKMCMSQQRWKDATKVLKTALQVAWLSFLAPSVNDITLPKRTVQYPIDLARRLRACYRYRRQPAKEENILLRLYHATRQGRQAGDPLLDSVTKGLVQLYERTRQTDKLITIHRDILNGYETHFGESHPVVLKELWALAELIRPQAACVDYYQRIFHILNKDSDTCNTEAFEPLLIVVTELVNQERYKHALQPYRVLFNTLKHPQTDRRLRDQTFVKSVYARYIHCLQVTLAEFHVIHDVTVEYRNACLTVFGAKGSITIQATKTLAHIAQSSEHYQEEAVTLVEFLLNSASNEVELDYEDIKATIQGLSQERSASTSAANSASSQETVGTRSKRLSTIRSTYGWVHENSLSEMEELASLYAKRNETQTAIAVLQEATIEILSSETSPLSLIAAAKSIASGYISIGLNHRGTELAREIHRQVVVRDRANINTAKFDLAESSSRRQALLFLAQLEYSLHESKNSSLSVGGIYSSLVAEYVYFECFRNEASSKSTALQDLLGTVSHLEGLLQVRVRPRTAPRATPGELSTILPHFRAHSSQNFLRSVALACYNGVVQHLSTSHLQLASDLALAGFKYLQAHDGLATMTTLKLIFKTGLALSAFGVKVPSRSQASKGQHGQGNLDAVSSTIVRSVVHHCKVKNLDLSHLDATHLNDLIKILDKQKDYSDLAWLLTSLWNKRQAHGNPQSQALSPSSSPTTPAGRNGTYTLVLGRMLVVTRYLVGEYTSAIRLAEDIVYNCTRVHGSTHPSTIEMSVLLSQMYTSVAQGYQDKDHHRELAYQYYKKAAGLHENALRALVDPTAATTDEGSGSASPDAASPASNPGDNSHGESSGKRARKHLHLLKLAVERLGSWPKEYSEYEQLNADLFKSFGDDLRGVEGVEKWNLKQFGAGKAEDNEDLVRLTSVPGVDLGGVPIAT